MLQEIYLSFGLRPAHDESTTNNHGFSQILQISTDNEIKKKGSKREGK